MHTKHTTQKHNPEHGIITIIGEPQDFTLLIKWQTIANLKQIYGTQKKLELFDLLTQFPSGTRYAIYQTFKHYGIVEDHNFTKTELDDESEQEADPDLEQLGVADVVTPYDLLVRYLSALGVDQLTPKHDEPPKYWPFDQHGKIIKN